MDEAENLQSPLIDLVCVGFGITAISNSIALYERCEIDNTLFLEAQPRAEWNPCPNILSERLRTSFLNDLITSENPRSKFTFLNYLHATDRLVLYANSSQLHPSREMFIDYLKWCAGPFESHVQFGKRVTSVLPSIGADGLVNRWKVIFKDVLSGNLASVVAKQLIYATELQPIIPDLLSDPIIRRKVLHASESLEEIVSLVRASVREMHIGVLGEGQNAAETFEFLQSIRGKHRVTWFSKDPILMGMDETPFLMHRIRKPPSARDQQLPPELRRRVLGRIGAETPPTVEPELLKRIYESQYAQSVKESDSRKWRFQIKLQHKLLAAKEISRSQIGLSFEDMESETPGTVVSDVFDVVIAATGFKLTGHEDVMTSLAGLVDGPQISVDRDYRVNLRSNFVSRGCGLWLLGTLIEKYENDDGLYLTTAERSRRVVESILCARMAKGNDVQTDDKVARL